MMRSESVKPNKFHRLLFKWFKPFMIHLVHAGPVRHSKQLDPDKVEFCFYDEIGRSYYRVKNDKDQPLIRKLFIANAYVRLVNAISEQDITLSLQAIEKAITEQDKKQRMKPNIARIGWVCKRLLCRKGTLVRIDLLRELAANYFIREDEPFEFVDENILAQKITTLSQGYDEQMKAFFFEKSVHELFPFIQDPAMIDNVVQDAEREVVSVMRSLNNYVYGSR